MVVTEPLRNPFFFFGKRATMPNEREKRWREREREGVWLYVCVCERVNFEGKREILIKISFVGKFENLLRRPPFYFWFLTYF